MDLKINRLNINSKSHVPVHVQLEEQLKHLILGGGLETGSRLPSIRELAGYLRVNRNTVARAVAGLEREGYVESRRGSGVYVTPPPVDAGDLKRQKLLEKVIEMATEQGVAVEEVGHALLARASMRVPEKVEKARILFVECNEPQLEQFANELEEQLPVMVDRVLLEELEGRLDEEEEQPWVVAVTTFFHVHEVQKLMEPRGVETVALLAGLTLDSLQRLKELPEGTEVGVVGNSRTCARNLHRSLEGAGLDHLNLVLVQEDKDGRLPSLPERIPVVVCTSLAARKLLEMRALEGADQGRSQASGSPRLRETDATDSLEIIEEDRTLDKGGIEMLRQVLRRLTSTVTG